MFRIKCDLPPNEILSLGSKRALLLPARVYALFSCTPFCVGSASVCIHLIVIFHTPMYRLHTDDFFPLFVRSSFFYSSCFNGKLLPLNVSHVSHSHESKRAARSFFGGMFLVNANALLKPLTRSTRATRSDVYVYLRVWFWWLCQWMFGGAHSKCTENRDVIF